MIMIQPEGINTVDFQLTLKMADQLSEVIIIRGWYTISGADADIRMYKSCDKRGFCAATLLQTFVVTAENFRG